MKRVGGLFDGIAEWSNLSCAAWNAGRGKRNRQAVVAFFDDFESNINLLIDQLQTGTLAFSPYETFVVRDPKIRQIHAPSFRDRVVHHAIIAKTGPVFEKGATDRSYACRKGKGQHACLHRARRWMRRDDWFLKLDVSKFYDSVPHSMVLQRLENRFRERRLIHLWKALIESYETEPGMGLPIGALTSQYLANFFLDPIDHRVLQSGSAPRYLRYMDDMLVIGNRSDLLETRDLVIRSLDRLGLRIKGNGIINRCLEGVPWLGFTIYPDRMRLDHRGRKRLRQKWKRLEKSYLSGEMCERELSTRTTSLFAHSMIADDVPWRRAILNFSRIGDGLETLDPRCAGRFLEQFRDELPHGDPEQEQRRQSQQEQRFSGWVVSRHGDIDKETKSKVPPDDAPSRARDSLTDSRDKPMHQPSPGVDIRATEKPRGEETGRGGNGMP